MQTSSIKHHGCSPDWDYRPNGQVVLCCVDGVHLWGGRAAYGVESDVCRAGGAGVGWGVGGHAGIRAGLSRRDAIFIS